MADDYKARLKAGGESLSRSGDSMIEDSRSSAAAGIHAVSYKKGGRVKRTGLARLHKGERVIPRSKVKRVEKMMKRSKMRMRTRS